MKKISIALIAFLLGLLINAALAVEVSLIGPKQYLRTTGAPNVYNDTFPGRYGVGKLIIKNGEKNCKNRVSSALIRINGNQILRPNDFNEQVYYMEIPVSLIANNSISLELRSKPGSYLFVEVKQDVEAEAASVVGPAGGILAAHEGIQAVIPPGSVEENIIAAITLVPRENLNFDILEDINFIGAINFDVGSAVLKDNAELIFPMSNPFLDGSQLFLGKLFPTTQGNILVMADTAHVEGGLIKTGDPASPGVISTGTYVFYNYSSPCGVPERKNFFAGKITPTCKDLINMNTYVYVVAPHLLEWEKLYLKAIDATIYAHDVYNASLTVATNILAFNGLGAKSVEELIAIGIGKTGEFTAILSQNDIAQIWAPLLTCALRSVVLDPRLVVCGSLVSQLFKTTSDFLTIIGIYSRISKVYELTIASDYLMDYYSWGGSQAKVAESLGLPLNTDLYGIIDKIAEKYEDVFPWWWPFNFDRYTIANLISSGQQLVIDFSRYLDSDRDGILNQLDNCPNTYNPDQADSDRDGIGDLCEQDGNVILVPNPSFEEGTGMWPDGWEPYCPKFATYIWDDTMAHTGVRSVSISNVPARLGTYKGWMTNGFFPVDPTKEYELSVWIFQKDTPVWYAYTYIGFLEYDANGIELGAFSWGADSHSVGYWTCFQMSYAGRLNPKTTKVRILLFCDNWSEQASPNATVWFDDVRLVRR